MTNHHEEIHYQLEKLKNTAKHIQDIADSLSHTGNVQLASRLSGAAIIIDSGCDIINLQLIIKSL